MNKEILNEQLRISRERNPGVNILAPGDLTSQETAIGLIKLLQAMYTEHGITKNVDKLISDIEHGDVLTWFARKNDQSIATASLVKQTDGAWEIGRAVSLERGGGIGKSTILEALKFHIENHPNAPLIAEVRAAKEFEGIPSGIATQKIFFGLVSTILPILPFAVAPLFSHGNPPRNEPFIISSSDTKPEETISGKISTVTNGRSTRGIVTKLKVVQTSPFRLAIPDDSGEEAIKIENESDNFNGCSFFPIEATDKNMPLIGTFVANPKMVLCGIDRVLGKEGKPIILIATIGINAKLAPIDVSEIIPAQMRKDIEIIADKFIR